MRRVRLVGGRVIDPSRGIDRVGDLVVENGRIVGFAGESGAAAGEDVFNVHGLVVAPGLVDIHCHAREPGYEHRETLRSVGEAALAGGFTTLCAMSDTDPTVDTGSDVRHLLGLARRDCPVQVLPLGTITKRREGLELSEMMDMAEAGAVAFSDDPRPVTSSALFRQALAYSRITALPIVSASVDPLLSRGALMNEGRTATSLGLPGAPREAEEVAVARDVALARLTGGRLHIAHVSAARSVDIIARAKDEGVRVTADVTPHHLLLGDDLVAGSPNLPPYDSRLRVEPPLRGEADRRALIDGLRGGAIDCIATDHSPLARVDKECEFEAAVAGISGLETALGLLMRLVEDGRLDLATLVSRLTVDAAQIFGLEAGTLGVGAVANLVVFDPSMEWKVDPAEFRSRGKNTPLEGEALRGNVALTIFEGTVKHRPGILAHA